MSYLAGQNNFQFSIIEINIIELLQNNGISVETIKVLRNLRIVCVCSNKGRKVTMWRVTDSEKHICPLQKRGQCKQVKTLTHQPKRKNYIAEQLLKSPIMFNSLSLLNIVCKICSKKMICMNRCLSFQFIQLNVFNNFEPTNEQIEKNSTCNEC